LAKSSRTSRAHTILPSSNKESHQLISHEWQSNDIKHQQSAMINKMKVVKSDESVIDEIIDRLTGKEFLR